MQDVPQGICEHYAQNSNGSIGGLLMITQLVSKPGTERSSVPGSLYK